MLAFATATVERSEAFVLWGSDALPLEHPSLNTAVIMVVKAARVTKVTFRVNWVGLEFIHFP
jgi:hypothetical protein